jgi:cytochrome c553
MPETIRPDEVRRIVSSDLTDDDVRALARWYANLASAVARFPSDHLRDIEPPLISRPGPGSRPETRV